MDNALSTKLGPFLLRVALGFPCLGDGYLKIYQMGGTTWAGALLSPVWQAIIAWIHLLSALAILVGIRTRWASGIILTCMLGETWVLNLWPTADQIWPITHKFFVLWLLAGGLIGVGGGDWKLELQPGSK